MFPRSNARAMAMLLALAFLAWPAGGATPDADVEAYLNEQGLRELLAIQLSERLERSPASERAAIAERLGSVYAQWLQEAESPEERRRVESLASGLLGRVPEAQTIDLRINLARIGYLEGARLAERGRLRLASDEELAEADRLLRLARNAFGDVASQAHRRVEMLERREKAGREMTKQMRAQLAEARRQRSVALYHSGWSGYYLALMTGNRNLALDALRDLAWILNSGAGRLPDATRVPEQLLEYEHVADAALAASLCHALRGSDAEAASWLLLIERSGVAPESIRDRLMLTRIAAYGSTRRWADLDWAIRQMKRSGDGELLTVSEARLLAVVTLEAALDRGTAERDRLLSVLTQVAFGDLIRAGEVGQVVDLVDRYGTTPIGSRGFIVRYVQGLRAFDSARELHAAIDDQGDAAESTSDPEIVAAYSEAARLLLDATNADDASEFSRELAASRVMIGLCRHYAGQHRDAAEQFETAAKLAPDEQRREEALWRAVASLERAITVDGHTDLEGKRAELIGLFVRLFPSSERTAGLMLTAGDAADADPAEAIEALLAVDPTSGLYLAARAEAANRLYAAFRSARGAEKRTLAVRARDLAIEVLRLEARVLDEAATDSQLERVVLRHRQILDAALFAELPDAELARASLSALEALSLEYGFDLGPLRGELDYRRLQLALLEGDTTGSRDVLRRLRGRDDRFSRLADTLVFNDAVRLWDRRPSDPRLAREVFTHGSRLLAGRQKINRMDAAIAQRVSMAAEVIWEDERDELILDNAIMLERRVLAAGIRTPGGLRRLATFSEAAGDLAGALDAWRLLLAALVPLDVAWYEARFESLRLLAEVDRERAIEAMNQHVLLNPEIGPEPWGDQIRDLAAELGVEIPEQESEVMPGDPGS